MNNILMEYLDNFCIIYLDDILIYSKEGQDYEEHIRKVLIRLQEASLQANIKKSEFSIERTKYLRLILTTKGVEIDPNKVAPITNWVRPRTITSIKSYLGFYGFYQQFIYNFSKITKPLSILTRPTIPFKQISEYNTTFKELRKQLLEV